MRRLLAILPVVALAAGLTASPAAAETPADPNAALGANLSQIVRAIEIEYTMTNNFPQGTIEVDSAKVTAIPGAKYRVCYEAGTDPELYTVLAIAPGSSTYIRSHQAAPATTKRAPKPGVLPKCGKAVKVNAAAMGEPAEWVPTVAGPRVVFS